MDKSKFNTLTQAYRRLVETHEALKEAAQKIKEDFEGPEGGYFFSNPIGYKTDLEETVKDARRIFTGFVVRQINKEYSNLTIGEAEIQKFVEERQNFDAAEIMKRIRELYADEDGIALKQIRETCSHLLPWGRFGDTHCKAHKPEHIPMINANGIQLKIFGEDYDMKERVSALIKLVDISLRGTKPSQAHGSKVELGQIYRDDKIKSLRYFKSGSLKVLFHNAEDCEKVKHALFGEQDLFEKKVEEHVKNMNVPESTGQHIIAAKTTVEAYLEHGAEKEGSE